MLMRRLFVAPTVVIVAMVASLAWAAAATAAGPANEIHSCVKKGDGNVTIIYARWRTWRPRQRGRLKGELPARDHRSRLVHR